ncbi:hypothetical protein, partial [Moritella viscosa]|uniref:hypothetical protein n=1 Tax=Moritella viscosa TaxID=80854 RepID=UPI003B429F82
MQYSNVTFWYTWSLLIQVSSCAMLLTMTDIEIYRINTIKNVIDKRISGVDAAALLNLSTRQV